MRGFKYLILLLSFASCSEQEKSVESEKIKEDSTVNVVQQSGNDSLPQSNRVLIKSDTSKIYAVTESNGFIYYREFYPEQPETDIGKHYLRVMKDDVILWSYELPRLAKVNDNGLVVAITDVESDKVTICNFKDGKVIHVVDLKYDITDGADVLLTSDYIYLSVNNNDNEMIGVKQISLSDYAEKTIELNEVGYYILKIDSDSVASVVEPKSGEEILELKSH